MNLERTTSFNSKTLAAALILSSISVGCGRPNPNPIASKSSTPVNRHVVSRLDGSRNYVRWACDQLSNTQLARLDLQEPRSAAGITPGENGAHVFTKIAAATHLKSLVLPKDTTDADLSCVETLTQLEFLSVARCRIRGEGLRSLRDIVSLKKLDLSNTFINDEALSFLPALPNLVYLDIGGAPLTAEALTPLTMDKFPNLIDLNVPGPFCDDSWATALLNMSQLQRLGLYGTRLTDQGLRRMAEHKSLRDIAIGRSYVSEEGLAEFRKLRPDVHGDRGPSTLTS